MRYLIGAVRCLECGAESISAWPLLTDRFEQECPECETMNAVPIRARAIEDWPDIAARVEMSNIRAAHVHHARQARES